MPRHVADQPVRAPSHACATSAAAALDPRHRGRAHEGNQGEEHRSLSPCRTWCRVTRQLGHPWLLRTPGPQENLWDPGGGRGVSQRSRAARVPAGGSQAACRPAFQRHVRVPTPRCHPSRRRHASPKQGLGSTPPDADAPPAQRLRCSPKGWDPPRTSTTRGSVVSWRHVFSSLDASFTSSSSTLNCGVGGPGTRCSPTLPAQLPPFWQRTREARLDCSHSPTRAPST